MLIPVVILEGNRTLVFQEGPATRVLSNFRPSEILAAGDEKTLRPMPSADPEIADSGFDFFYVAEDGARVGIQVKVASKSSLKRQFNDELRRVQAAGQFDRWEVWTLSKDASSLAIHSANENVREYGLQNVTTDRTSATERARPGEHLNSQYIQRRAEQWKVDVEALFQRIEGWCGNSGYRTTREYVVEMNEELMRRFAVSPILLPMLRILRGKRSVATVIPVGLWVIGAKGRLDIISETQSAAIVNVSDDPGDPTWKLFFTGLSQSQPMTEQALLEILDDNEGA